MLYCRLSTFPSAFWLFVLTFSTFWSAVLHGACLLTLQLFPLGKHTTQDEQIQFELLLHRRLATISRASINATKCWYYLVMSLQLINRNCWSLTVVLGMISNHQPRCSRRIISFFLLMVADTCWTLIQQEDWSQKSAYWLGWSLLSWANVYWSRFTILAVNILMQSPVQFSIY